jgi:LPXTG-motif cell wall-anchored protein
VSQGHPARKGISAALAAGVAASVGALIFWRRRRDAGDAPADLR